MRKVLFVLPLIAMFFSFCGKDEDPMQREEKEMNEAMSGPVPDAYKAFKVALRGTAVTGKDSLFDQARMNMLAATGYMLVESMRPDSLRDLDNVIRLAKSAQVIAESVPTLLKTDEDSLPTILENIGLLLDPENPQTTIALSSILNEDEEHLLLAGGWIVSQRAPVSICLYEMSKVDDNALSNPNMQCLSKMARCILYYENKWPYHAEKAADELVTITEKEKAYLLENPWPGFDVNGKKASPEQSWHQLHGLAYMLRGICRLEMKDRHDDAVDDFEKFVEEAEAGGLDNEVTWSAGAYAAISKEDKDKAIVYLDKLAASKNLSQAEIDAVKSTRDYVSKREKDNALNTFSDKIAIMRIAATYIGKQLAQSKPVQDLNNSKGGKEFMRLTKISPGNMLEGKPMSTDSLYDKSQSLLKKIGL